MILLTNIALFLICYIYILHNTGKKEMILALSLSSVMIVFFIYLSTNILSLFRLITPLTMRLLWGAVMLTSIMVLTLRLRKNKCSVKRVAVLMLEDKNIKKVIGISLFFSSVSFLAYLTMPNNTDSFTYHLPRVFYWARNNTVSHYAASYDFQVTAPVLSEYILLHVYQLSGETDRFLHLVQSVTYALSSFLIYGISKKLGVNKLWSWIASFIFMSSPIVFAEALSTQNDIVTAFLFLCGYYILLFYMDSIRGNGGGQRAFSVALPISFALTFLSKEYSGLPMALLYLWYFHKSCKYKGIQQSVKVLLFHMMVGFIIILPERIRVFNTIGAVYTPAVSSGQLINTLDIRLIMIAFLRNLFFNFSSHYFYNSKAILEYVVERLAGVWGVVSNDPRIGGRPYSLNVPFVYTHDSADNILIASGYLIAIVLLILLLMKKRKIENMGLHVVSLLSFTLFMSIITFTKHRTRYEILFFAFLCPTVCYVIQLYTEGKEVVKISIASIIISVGLCELINSYIYHWEAQRTHDRTRGNAAYFYNIDRENIYKEICNLVKLNNCKKIGSHLEPGSYEYPLLIMLSEYEVKNINVDNDTKKYEDMDYLPDCLIYMGSAEKYSMDDIIFCHGHEYRVVYEQDISKLGFIALDAFAIRVN